MTVEGKYPLIREEVLKHTEKNPITIAKACMALPEVNMHGPEHHFIDGASFLMAYKNSGNELDIEKALDQLAERTIKMPGAMCGYWGVCGSSTALGAAMSIIHQTTPLSDDLAYRSHMRYTSSVIDEMAGIGGPRCCKRNAYISLILAVKHMNRYYSSNMEISDVDCIHTDINPTCIKERCPFYNK